MFNEKKFNELVSGKNTKTAVDIEWRLANKHWLKKSQKIAFRVLRTLKTQGLTQKNLAEMLNVSEKVVSRWLSGKENFTLETISKIENVLNIQLLTINYEK